MPPISKKRVLITVRTYPVPANKGAETSCTAAISEDGDWVRIFPVPYRSLPISQRFKKFQWIEADLKKAGSDTRPESHNIDITSIKLGELVPTTKEWSQRRALLRPLMRASMCAIRRELDANGHPTLGIFSPKTIKRLLIEPCSPDWNTNQKAILSQKSFGFDAAAPKAELQKIPFDFYYEFTCDDLGCKGHKMSCTDWEMAEAYRGWKIKYGDGWEAKFRERFERDMIEKFDTHFFVGTMHGHPKNWLIVGLFYPPKKQKDLFD